jgi:hypothetical protein
MQLFWLICGLLVLNVSMGKAGFEIAPDNFDNVDNLASGSGDQSGTC